MIFATLFLFIGLNAIFVHTNAVHYGSNGDQLDTIQYNIADWDVQKQDVVFIKSPPSPFQRRYPPRRFPPPPPPTPSKPRPTKPPPTPQYH